MGSGDLTGSLGLPVGADTIVADYLSRLDAALAFSARERERIVTEAADALACAIEAAVAEGEPASAAARSAVTEFGHPETVSAHFAVALVPGKARRTGLALVLTGPVIGLAWVAALGQGVGWPARISSVIVAMPYLALVLMLTAPAAVAAVLSGWNRLRLKDASRFAATAAWLSTLGSLAADVLLLTAATGRLMTGSVTLTGWVACAAVLSGVRLAAIAIASRNLSRLRVAGN